MQKDKPPSVLGEALLDAVIAPTPVGIRRTGARRAEQPANAFVSRSGELASSSVAPLSVLDRGEGEGVSGTPKNNDQEEVEVPRPRPKSS